MNVANLHTMSRIIKEYVIMSKYINTSPAIYRLEKLKKNLKRTLQAIMEKISK